MSVEPQLADYLESHLDDLAAQLATQLRAMPNPEYARAKPEQFQQAARQAFQATIAALRGDVNQLREYSGNAIRSSRVWSL